MTLHSQQLPYDMFNMSIAAKLAHIIFISSVAATDSYVWNRCTEEPLLRMEDSIRRSRSINPHVVITQVEPLDIIRESDLRSRSKQSNGDLGPLPEYLTYSVTKMLPQFNQFLIQPLPNSNCAVSTLGS